MARSKTAAQIRDESCRVMRDVIAEVCSVPAKDWASMDDALQSLIMARNMLKATKRQIDEAKQNER